MTARARLRRTFHSFGVRNFRIFFAGQLVSVAGTWMQRIAQSWLVLQITGSGTAVGAVTALQFIPMLVAPAGGLFADRVDKRRLLTITTSASAVIALVLGGLVLTDTVELWMVYVLAFLLGVVGSFENPARRAFVVEMVGRDAITNALGLTSVMVNTARIFGPVLAGILIVTVGIGMCFVLNGISYLALIVALIRMRPEDLVRAKPLPRRTGQLREGISYVRETPLLTGILVILAVVSVFAYEYEVVLPLMAKFAFGGDADTFGVMFGAVAVGAVAGGFYAANVTVLTPRSLVARGAAFAGALGLAAVAPSLVLELGALAVVGATGTSFLSVSNSMLQVGARSDMQGRVLSLRAVAFLGARPIGAPTVGWISEHVGPRYALATGGLAVLAVVLLCRRSLGTEALVPDAADV